jgi:hypothetical protein
MSLNTHAKSQSGIYLSPSDFKNNKLTYEDNCTDRTHIHIHDFFWSMPAISVTHDGKKYTYKKSEVYGYRDCKNEVYRFYNSTEYRIVEAGEIFVYVLEKNIAQSKGFIVVNEYYFSTAADNEVLPLTLSNLKSSYMNNDKFLRQLATMNADDVQEYDQAHSTFKINYLYSKTTNNNH